MNRPTCATCCFWAAWGDPPAGGTWACRRRAPVVGTLTAVGAREWPTTNADDWCGEHVARLSPREVSVAFSHETEVRFDDGGKDKPT